MILKKVFKGFLFFFLLLSFFSCKKDVGLTETIKQRPLYKYSWYEEGSNTVDTLKIPQIIETRLFLENIRSLDRNVDFFTGTGDISLYSGLLEPYVDFENDTIFDPNFPNAELNLIMDYSETYYESWAGDIIENDEGNSVYEVNESFEGQFFHNWDLRKYPFDKQKLRIEIKSLKDTSLVRLRNSPLFPSAYNKKNNLKQGYKINSIDFKEEFVEVGTYNEYLGRQNVLSFGVYEIIVSRNGVWMFIKLFFGGVLSLVLSWLVFFIPLRDFSSRIELSIGAVFAAVGNKYFVDAATDSQVLTVADLFNNIIILMVVINVALVIIKRNPSFKNEQLNNSESVAKLSFGIASVLFIALAVYTAL